MRCPLSRSSKCFLAQPQCCATTGSTPICSLLVSLLHCQCKAAAQPCQPRTTMRRSCRARSPCVTNFQVHCTGRCLAGFARDSGSHTHICTHTHTRSTCPARRKQRNPSASDYRLIVVVYAMGGHPRNSDAVKEAYEQVCRYQTLTLRLLKS